MPNLQFHEDALARIVDEFDVSGRDSAGRGGTCHPGNTQRLLDTFPCDLTFVFKYGKRWQA